MRSPLRAASATTSTAKLACAVLTVGTFVLTGCGGSSGSSTTSAPSNPPATSAPASAEPSASASAAGGGTGQKMSVSQTITDTDLQNTIKISDVVRNFPVPARFPAIQDRELVLVHMQITAGDKITGGVNTGQFTIIPDDGSDTNVPTTIVDQEMTDAGYTPIPNGGQVSSGKNADGWVAFRVDKKGSSKLTLRYKRDETRIIGGGGTIPEKTWEVPLVG